MKMNKQQAELKAKQASYVSPLASILTGYTHDPRTNLKEKKLNNRDAICLLFSASDSCLTAKQLRDAMMTWRFGKATYKAYKYVICKVSKPSYRKEAHQYGSNMPLFERYVNHMHYRLIPKMSFSAYFHPEPYWFGHCATSFSPRSKKHLWFRTETKGVYSLTLHGIKRCEELKGTE